MTTRLCCGGVSRRRRDEPGVPGVPGVYSDILCIQDRLNTVNLVHIGWTRKESVEPNGRSYIQTVTDS